MVEARRGRLSSGARAALEGHVSTCEACKHEEALDAVLDVALSKLTPEPPPSGPRPNLPPLTTRLETARTEVRAAVRRRMVVGLFGIAALGLAVAVFPRGYVEPDPLVREAVNDHVRVLSADRPVEIAGDSVDKVAPWLGTRLDFAPTNTFDGDTETKLVGASVAYFIDRKAAAFVYARDSHKITVLAFRADGLPWRDSGSRYSVATRGYRALLFRHGDLGYAVISDLNENALLGIASKVDAP
jgi:anti-sigma factor RsiW